ncbi:hypothetical protein INS49_007567 [Diaporthe citri]|uniref:uncharacterized protein n=1 Tax=Diaporthe citri TaxID=83186 RepID=UPI001C8058E9|nr:uncharacterized protein INS49_007567 [Diaporthe citri]KAG6353268.1 hypothetical protein INS49_007567 [Diaporthe citri]
MVPIPTSSSTDSLPGKNAWYTAWGYVPVSQLLPVLDILLEYGADSNAYVENNVRLSKRKWQKSRHTVLLVASDDPGSYADCGSDDDSGYYAETRAEQERLDKFIGVLKKRGGKTKEWREETKVFVRHAILGGLQAQKLCTIL